MWWMTLLACGGSEPAPAPAPTSAPAPAPAPEPEPEAPPAPEPGMFGMRGVDWACAVCSDLLSTPGVDVQVTASSVLDPEKYAASNVLGPDLAKAWCEGEKDGPGIGSTLKVEFGRPLMIDAIGVYGGFFKSLDLLGANGRIETFRLTTDNGVDQVYTLEDPAKPKKVDPSTSQPIDDWFAALQQGEPPWQRVHGTEKPATWAQIEILSVYPGAKYTDTCVSRIDLLVVDPEELD